MGLEELIVDEGLDEQAVEDILKPHARLSRNGRIQMRGKFFQLKASQKVLIFLIAKRAVEFLAETGRIDPLEEIFGTTPSEIASELGLKGNTLRPTLKRLKERGLVIVLGGTYSIPNYALQDVKEFLEGGEENGPKSKCNL